jgi:hypothetical protein
MFVSRSPLCFKGLTQVYVEYCCSIRGNEQVLILARELQGKLHWGMQMHATTPNASSGNPQVHLHSWSNVYEVSHALFLTAVASTVVQRQFPHVWVHMLTAPAAASVSRPFMILRTIM